MSASPHAGSTTSPTKCSRRCASSSAATTRSRPRGLMAIELEVVADEKAAARRAAELIAAIGAEAVAERNIFSLAMSGGRTPWAMLAMLGEEEQMSWDKTELFQ